MNAQAHIDNSVFASFSYMNFILIRVSTPSISLRFSSVTAQIRNCEIPGTTQAVKRRHSLALHAVMKTSDAR